MITFPEFSLTGSDLQHNKIYQELRPLLPQSEGFRALWNVIPKGISIFYVEELNFAFDFITLTSKKNKRMPMPIIAFCRLWSTNQMFASTLPSSEIKIRG